MKIDSFSIGFCYDFWVYSDFFSVGSGFFFTQIVSPLTKKDSSTKFSPQKRFSSKTFTQRKKKKQLWVDSSVISGKPWKIVEKTRIFDGTTDFLFLFKGIKAFKGWIHMYLSPPMNDLCHSKNIIRSYFFDYFTVFISYVWLRWNRIYFTSTFWCFLFLCDRLNFKQR